MAIDGNVWEQFLFDSNLCMFQHSVAQLNYLHPCVNDAIERIKFEVSDVATIDQKDKFSFH